MTFEPKHRSDDRSNPSRPTVGSTSWQPQFEVVSLDCEITAYAPDGDEPLF